MYCMCNACTYVRTFTDHSSVMAAVASPSSPGANWAKGKRQFSPMTMGAIQSGHTRFFIPDWEVAVVSDQYCPWEAQLLADNVSICNVPGGVTYGCPHPSVVKLNMPLTLG